MDTFFEQIVRVKRTGGQTAGVVGIMLLAGLLIAVCLFFILYTTFAPIAIVVLFGVCWGAFKLIQRSSIEYEYIFTNGDLDVDKIIARSSRKRVASVNCTRAERFGKYNPAARVSDSVSKVYLCCDADDENAKFIIAPTKKDGNVMIVFAPDERMLSVIEKSIPRLAK